MATFTMFSCKNENDNKNFSEKEIVENVTPTSIMDQLTIHPISHATMVLEWSKTVIYVDPIGEKKNFEGMKNPDIILLTDIHGDHLDIVTLVAIVSENTKIIAPKAVIEKLPKSLEKYVIFLGNNGMKSILDIEITGIPMYNLRKEALQYHEKGRGNGYVLKKDGKSIYISGDTEDIPEMRNLKNIDLAFVCMNLPYTMTIGSAADAISEFKPKIVVPYHYRGTDGLSNIDGFEKMVNQSDPSIEVMRLDWYPSKQ
jgi:L-ascorbate metabolism protein UlaG (beta-lactamase superfamily)